MTKGNKRDFSALLSIPVSEEAIESADHDTIRLYMEKEEYLSQRQDREQRKDFAGKIFLFVKYYMVVILLLIIANGYCQSFSISDDVLMMLLGTTTANIVGLFAFVAKYLFQTKK